MKNEEKIVKQVIKELSEIENILDRVEKSDISVSQAVKELRSSVERVLYSAGYDDSEVNILESLLYNFAKRFSFIFKDLDNKTKELYLISLISNLVGIVAMLDRMFVEGGE